jgi:hypothetical protein
LTVLSVIVSVLGTVAFGGVVFGVVRLVLRARRQKETEYDRASGQESGDERRFWGSGLGFFNAWFPGKGSWTDVENGEEAETRPLLE